MKIYTVKVIEHTDLNTKTWTVTHLCVIAETDPVKMLKPVNHTWYFHCLLLLYMDLREKTATSSVVMEVIILYFM